MAVNFWSLLAIQLFYCIAIIAVAVTVAFDNHKIRWNWRVFVCILYYHIWGEFEFQFQNFETHLLILFLLHKLDFFGGLLGQWRIDTLPNIFILVKSLLADTLLFDGFRQNLLIWLLNKELFFGPSLLVYKILV